MGMTAERIRELIDQHKIHTVRVGLVDNSGVVRARNVPAGHFARTGLEDGIQYPSAMFSVDTAGNFVPAAGAGIASGYTSWLLKPVLDTFTILPYNPGSARVLADVYHLDGSIEEAVPRQVLNRVLAQLAAEGYTTRGAAEFEFYVFKSPIEGTPQPTWTGTTPSTSPTSPARPARAGSASCCGRSPAGWASATSSPARRRRLQPRRTC